MGFWEFIKQALSNDSATSSKRICGFMGWFVCLGCVIYAVLFGNESPDVVDTLFLASTSLLGLDSVVNIFRKK